MKPVNVAILGACGWMGKCHSMGYRNAPLMFPELGSIPKITWLVDDAAARLDQIKGTYGDVKTSTKWQDALKDTEVNLVDICLPDHLHFEVAKAALLAGKNVYCEKPFTATGDEARELADIASEKGLITRVGHNFPKNPVHDLTKEMIENGEIGDIPVFLQHGGSGEDFYRMIADQIDVMYEDGARQYRVLAIALHPFIVGHPFRAKYLERALAYIRQREAVWITTGSAIVDWYNNAAAS